jgi:hypothetical protein
MVISLNHLKTPKLKLSRKRDWALGTCTERLVPSISTSLDGAGAEVSRKACGIATLRAQPLVEKYWALG